MKLKTVSFATMKQGHLYMNENLNEMYKVSKTYNGRNVSIEIFELSNDNSNNYPRYSVYTFMSEEKVAHKNCIKKVYDLGTKSTYYRKDYETLIHTKIDKTISDFNRFIKSIS